MPAVEKVKFQTNIPEIVALQYAQGKAVESPYTGDQVMFTLVDGRVMYLPPFVADKIHGAGIPARQPFAIVKREVTHGNRRSVEYQIETHNSPNPQGAPSVKENAPHKETATAPTRTPQPVQNTKALAIAAQLAESLAQPATQTDSDVLKATGRAAIDAVLDVERYAQERGLTDFAFGAEDVRALWISSFIEASRSNKGGR